MGKHDQIQPLPLPPLCTLTDAAKHLGIPKASLQTAAEKHGYIVRMGRAIRIETDRLGELVKKCRDQQRAQGSTNTSTGQNGISSTPELSPAQRAAQIAERLKNPSPATSRTAGGTVLRMNRKT